LLGAEVIVCPANLVTDAWKVVMPARAVENHVYLAVANRSGQEARGGEKLVFKGSSVIYDYTGQVIKSAGRTEDEVLLATVDPGKARDKSTNAINNSLLDRKPHHYSPITAS
jgi:predicted amidohydrolase